MEQIKKQLPVIMLYAAIAIAMILIMSIMCNS